MSQHVVIVDFGSGNLRSVEKAIERAARERGIAAQISVSDAFDVIASADRIVLPGVGAFAACMAGLSQRPGVLEALEHGVLIEGRPFLGVCVGMQLLAEKGTEFGDHAGLGWMTGKVTPIDMGPGRLRVPHMGWNAIEVLGEHPVMNGCDGEAFYFAHSFHVATGNDAQILAVTDYGGAITAAIARDNIVGVQFHPEKSQAAGLQLIGNFLAWSPS